MKRISEEHEWVEVNADVATVGITAFAAEELGDVTFVELPEVGQTVSQGDSLGVVESVKAASDIFAPLGGTVVEVNSVLEEKPGLVNDSPEEDGWFCRLNEISAEDLDDLMTPEEYEEFVAGSDE